MTHGDNPDAAAQGGASERQAGLAGVRPDEAKHREGVHQFLTEGRRRLIQELRAIAYNMGSVAMRRRIGMHRVPLPSLSTAPAIG